ncbi:MAG: glutamate-5-semialdehyde dehydrogenase [Candidatus Brocadiia bacterium]
MDQNIPDYVEQIGGDAKAASRALGEATADQKNAILLQMADNILAAREELKEENERDLQAGRDAGLSDAMLDRLELTDRRIEGMAESIRTIAGLKDPVGSTVDGWVLPNGLRLQKRRVPIGVIGIIYESRPNVTADAAALCLKSGNGVVLRGGKEALHSNLAIHRQLEAAFKEAELSSDVVQMIDITDRAVVPELLTAEDYVDVIIPRGGKGLIRTVVENATIPVIKHYEGICHTYVDKGCDLDMAWSICENAKCQRPGVCNAMETLLVHADVAEDFLPRMAERLRAEGVELRGCERTGDIIGDTAPATEEDWATEYLDLTLAIRVVDDIDTAVDHINTYGSAHSDAIVTRDVRRADRFLSAVDSATVYVNASTRFTDGGQFGLGAEIGISTDKLHARGPMALEELTTYKWTIRGDGQLRT